MSKLLSVIALLLLLTSAHAAESQVVEKPLVAQTLEGFDKEAATIRAGMQPGGRYEFLKPDDKNRVEARLASMQKLLQKHAGQSDLNSTDKIALVNEQEEVNALLRHNDGNRLVCENRAPVGSHLPVKTCRTYGEIELERQAAMRMQTDLDRNNVRHSGN
jgi:hypothetical protein